MTDESEATAGVEKLSIQSEKPNETVKSK